MTSKPNRSERRAWDKYVAEARDTKSEIDLGGGVVLTVYIPSADAVSKLSESDDLWTQVHHIMGEDNAEKLRAVAGDAPVTALRSLLTDVMADLGIGDDSGE